VDRETKSVATRSRRKPATASRTPGASIASDLQDARAQQAAVNEVLPDAVSRQLASFQR